jgi:hypothetical protein
MNTFKKHPLRWSRWVQAGFIIVLACLMASIFIAMHVLKAESATPSAVLLAGGLSWIAILLWGILFVQMMALLNSKCPEI